MNSQARQLLVQSPGGYGIGEISPLLLELQTLPGVTPDQTVQRDHPLRQFRISSLL